MEPLNQGSLWHPGIAIIYSSKMVGDQDPCCLAIETYIIFLAKLIFGLCTREWKIDQEALVWLCGLFNRIGTSSCFGLLGSNTCGVIVHDRVHVFELRDTFHILVGIVKVVITGMTKMLVPQHTLHTSFDSKHRGMYLNVLIERKRVFLLLVLLSSFWLLLASSSFFERLRDFNHL